MLEDVGLSTIQHDSAQFHTVPHDSTQVHECKCIQVYAIVCKCTLLFVEVVPVDGCLASVHSIENKLNDIICAVLVTVLKRSPDRGPNGRIGHIANFKLI